MRARIVDIEQVAAIDLRQAAVNGELVVVLAQAANDVIDVIRRSILLAQHGDVVVRAVHRRAHQVAGAGVHADVLLVGVLLVNRRGDERAVWAEHEAAQLGKDRDVAHARGHEHLLVGPAHALADDRDVVGGILRPVWDAHAAGEVDERDFCAGLPVQLHRFLEENPRERRVVFVGQCIGGEECVQAEALCALLHEHAVGLRQLLAGHAVLRVLGHVHDVVADGEIAAGIEAAADQLRHAAHALHGLDERIVVEVDDRALRPGARKLRIRRLIRREHDLVPGKSRRLGEHQLRLAGAVHAAALLAQDAQDERVGCRLHGKILLEARIPGKRSAQRPRGAADARLVIDMERRGILPDDLPRLLQRHKRCLHAHSPCFPRRRDAA